MKLKLIAACVLPFLFTHCSKDGSPNPVQTPGNGELTKAAIIGTLDSLTVGDSVSLCASYEASGGVDTGEIEFCWEVQRNDSILVADTGREFASWIPREPGQYRLTLNEIYEGKTVTVIVIVIVMERIVYVDTTAQAQLRTYQDSLPGYYAGVVNTPWTSAYRVAFAFYGKGTYSAYNAESDVLPALYYGTDADGPQKTWALDDVKANGTVSGSLVILFDVGTTTQDEIRDMKFSAGFDSLEFSVWHFGTYGPVTLSLVRIDSSDMPPRPLPTPSITVSGTLVMMDYQDSVTVRLSSRDGLAIVYQVLPMPAAGFDALNPLASWRADIPPTPYAGPFIIRSGGEDDLLLARETDGTRYSGAAAQVIYFAGP